jgi:LmbE family N-acetylglucosaminyl deacetylase
MAVRPPVVKAIGDDARQDLQAKAKVLDTAKLKLLAPLLLIIPHADDEVLGCGGLIAEASDLRLGLQIVYLTDGAASHRGSPTWPPDRLARVRRQEALQALAILGVKNDQVLFLDWPDASPHSSSSEAFTHSVEVVFRWAGHPAPRSVWAPYEGEAHCDHQAAWALASAIRNRWTSPPPDLLAYLVWAWNEPDIARTLDGRTVWNLACAHQTARRRRALACHETQLGTLIDDAAEAFALPAALSALADGSSQLFVEA